MTFKEKYEQLINDMNEVLGIIITYKGEESKHYSEKVLKPDDEFMFNLEGIGCPYVEEVANGELICNYGHKYDYSCLDTEELCKLTDHLREKYA